MKVPALDRVMMSLNEETKIMPGFSMTLLKRQCFDIIFNSIFVHW